MYLVNNLSKDYKIKHNKISGFYRVNYDISTWHEIINVLSSKNYKNINELDRAAVVDDMLNLARAEYLNYDISLLLFNYLKQETSYFPLKSAITGINYLIKRFQSHATAEQFYYFSVRFHYLSFQN